MEFKNISLYNNVSFPSFEAILDLVCETFLKRNVSAILFLSNTELYGRNTAAAQYFLQLTNYLRIPVIAWNADNSGLEKVIIDPSYPIHLYILYICSIALYIYSPFFPIAGRRNTLSALGDVACNIRSQTVNQSDDL